MTTPARTSDKWTLLRNEAEWLAWAVAEGCLPSYRGDVPVAFPCMAMKSWAANEDEEPKYIYRQDAVEMANGLFEAARGSGEKPYVSTPDEARKKATTP